MPERVKQHSYHHNVPSFSSALSGRNAVPVSKWFLVKGALDGTGRQYAPDCTYSSSPLDATYMTAVRHIPCLHDA